MTFAQWLESQGCHVECVQEDDGSGYECLSVLIPDGITYEISVNT